VYSLSSKTVNSIKWSYFSTIATAVLQIGYTAVMARLLLPKAFGLVAMAGIILRFVSYFSQMGVGQAIIQKKEIKNEDIRSSFTSSFLLGAFFFGIIWIAAPLALYVFNNDQVIPIIRIMGLSFIISGLSITSISLLQRTFSFRAIAIVEIISYVIGYLIVGILFAISGFGVWSLVASSLCQSLISALIAYYYSRHNLKLIFSWKYYKPLFSFGSRVSIIGFLEFIGGTLDTIFIGHSIGASSLGIYNRASMLVNLPMQYLTSSLSRVLLPTYSNLQTEFIRLKKVYLTSILLMSALLIPITFGISACAKEIVFTILGPKWAAAAPILGILAIVTPLNLLTHFSAVVCEATARLNVKIIIQMFFISALIFFFYLFHNLGLIGYALAMFAGELIRNILYTFVLAKMLSIKPGEFWNIYIPSLLSGFIIAASLYFISLILTGINISNPVIFSIDLIAGAAVFLTFLLKGPQRLVRKEITERLSSVSNELTDKNLTGRFIFWLLKIIPGN
jgi:O-antigen/teichoic acid export membrane protein